MDDLGTPLTCSDVLVMQEGEIKVVPIGFWRNYLLPTGIAKIADSSILE